MAMAEMAPSSQQQKIGRPPSSPYTASSPQIQQQMQQKQQQMIQQQILNQKLKEKKFLAGAAQGAANAVAASAAAASPPVPAPAPGGVSKGKPDPVELEMARQDLMRVCNPDIHRPFSSLEDACERLLPYHVVAEYDSDVMDERVTDGQSSGGTLSRAQAWNDTLSSKSRDYFLALQKQIAMYNLIMRKRWEGDMRGEERLMVEQYLLEDEKQKLMELRQQMESEKEEIRTQAEKEAKMKEAIAQAERVRAEQQGRAPNSDSFQSEMNLNVKAQLDSRDVNMFWASDADEDDGGKGDGDADEGEGEPEGEGDGDGDDGDGDGEGDGDDSEGMWKEEEDETTGRAWGHGTAQFDLNARTR